MARSEASIAVFGSRKKPRASKPRCQAREANRRRRPIAADCIAHRGQEDDAQAPSDQRQGERNSLAGFWVVRTLMPPKTHAARSLGGTACEAELKADRPPASGTMFDRCSSGPPSPTGCSSASATYKSSGDGPGSGTEASLVPVPSGRSGAGPLRAAVPTCVKTVCDQFPASRTLPHRPRLLKVFSQVAKVRHSCPTTPIRHHSPLPGHGLPFSSAAQAFVRQGAPRPTCARTPGRHRIAWRSESNSASACARYASIWGRWAR